VLGNATCDGDPSSFIDGGHNLQFGSNPTCPQTIPVLNPNLDLQALQNNGGNTLTIAIPRAVPRSTRSASGIAPIRMATRHVWTSATLGGLLPVRGGVILALTSTRQNRPASTKFKTSLAQSDSKQFEEGPGSSCGLRPFHSERVIEIR
jgi:hypothetical protein